MKRFDLSGKVAIAPFPSPRDRRHCSARTAAGRFVTPDDFAGIAAFLASLADFVTGADIAVDRGFIWGV
jgi:NAD(P)-dependent dehydrogenase (short-subunit alcohol dehydrogenase family)